MTDDFSLKLKKLNVLMLASEKVSYFIHWAHICDRT